MNLPQLEQSITEYVTTVDELYGHYLDATSGFVSNFERVERAQQRAKPHIPMDVDPDSSPMFYGHGDPNDPSNRMLHKTTVGEYKCRNAKGGHNHVRAAQLLIVLIYEYWESEYRTKVADALGKNRNDLKIPMIGDLRLLRQDIIHHRSIVREETARKLEVLEVSDVGTELVLSDTDVEALVRSVKATLDDLQMQNGGNDPKHRQVWRVQ